MAQSNSPPGLWNTFRKDMNALARWLRGEGPDSGLDPLLNSDWMFGITQAGGRRRRWIAIFIGALLWASYAYSTNPYPWDKPSSMALLTYPIRALFSPLVFLSAIILAVSFGIVLPRVIRMLGEERFPKSRFRVIYLALGVIVGSIWGWLAYSLYPLELSPDFVSAFLSYPFDTLFAAEVFRHVLAAGIGFWLAYQAAVQYLQDVFELPDVSVAERHLLQSAFGSQYNLINIRNGEVPADDENTTIIQIGGPGLVRVHLENAALFETTEGRPRVVPEDTADPSKKKDLIALRGFERLRSVIDLLDQMGVLPSVDSRTRDGIRVQAKDVRFLYSISRKGREPTLALPYPFDPEAVEKLVYDQGSGHWTMAMEGMVRTELQKFISQHNLVEFLASISEPEYEDAQQVEAELSEQFGPQDSGSIIIPSGILPVVPFVARTEITEIFETDFRQRATNAGFELKWIGIGTWVIPAAIIPEQHLEAWKISRDNWLRGSQREMDRARIESFRAEFLRLVQEIPIGVFNRNAGQARSPEEIMNAMIRAYRELLRRAYEVNLEEGDQAEADRIAGIIGFLARFTYRWLGIRE